MRASKLVQSVTGAQVQVNKAIVGANAFAHESGIHQDGMLKNRGTYEIMTPESIGLAAKSNLVMGKHSGRHAFRDKLKELGIQLGDNAFEDAFLRFKDLADKKKDIYDDDIIALVGFGAAVQVFKHESLSINCGTEGPGTATVALNIKGTSRKATVEGDGPVDAAFRAIKALVPHEATLDLYQVSAVTRETAAQAEVTVRLADGETVVTGHGADTDTLVASAQAYLSALNHLERRKSGVKLKLTDQES
jgi:2-isopropylmalate synthase